MTDQPTNPAINLTSGAFWGRNPHDELTWMRQNAPVYFDANSNAWGIANHGDIKDISKNPETFSSAQGIRSDAPALPMMIDMDDPEHWARRKLINRGFTPKRVRAQEEYLRSLCDQIIDKICEQGECDFIWDIAAWLPLIVIGDQLGFAPEDRPTLLKWSDDLLRGLTGLDDEEAMVKTLAAFEGYNEYATRVAEERRGCPADDLMSILVHAEIDGDRLDLPSVLMESLLILIGGDETTRHVISGGAWQVLNDRSQWERIVADPGTMPVALEEMLRWVTPIKNMARVVTTDVELRGQQLKAGQKLLMLYPSANRDEDIFDNPFTFDMGRTPNEHLAFGAPGTHFCLGNSLARLELRVMFEQLAARLPDLELVNEEEPAYRRANFVSGYEAMPVRFSPGKPVGAQM